MTILKATLDHLNDIIPLFDAYRMFYKQTSNTDKAKSFLGERLKNNESIIYIAYLNNKAVGFTQLYSIFSSVTMERFPLLNDLYVDKDVRGQGIGEALINAAKTLCKEKGLKGLALETAQDNPAQHLYERLGFQKDNYLHYFWSNI